MYAEYLIVGSCRPVIFGIDHAPFLSCHSTEYKGMGRFVSALYQCPGNTKHHGNSGIVILKSIKIGIVMSR